MELLHSVTEFFHDEVKDALKARRVEAAAATEFYLVNLLVEFTSSAQDESPLALKMAAAASGPPEVRVRALREVGDTSLYMSGFFAEAIERKLVDLDYYIAMGGSAYRQLAGMMAGSAFREVYGELAGKFPAFVDVFGEIRSHSNFTGTSGHDLVKMYEEWRRTGSEWLEKRLRASGMLSLDAVNGNSTKH
jgi:hypothetical protein